MPPARCCARRCCTPTGRVRTTCGWSAGTASSWRGCSQTAWATGSSSSPGAARLFKAGLGRDATRPLVRKSGKAFTPRAYALLCLTLAALTRGKGQLLVDELVAQVRSAAVDAGLDVDLDAIADRRALHAAFAALVELGVLHERDGDLEHWAEQRTASLLDVRRDRLALLVAAPLARGRGPGRAARRRRVALGRGRRAGRRPAPSRRVAGAVGGRADRRAGRVVAARPQPRTRVVPGPARSGPGAARRGRGRLRPRG